MKRFVEKLQVYHAAKGGPRPHARGRVALAGLAITLLALGALQPLPAAASCSVPFFGPQTTFAAGDGPRSVAVGDFNGDGAPDLAVANGGDGNVSVRLNLNNASGGFGPQTAFAAGDGAVFVAVGDFNGDGALDLAVGNGTGSNTVSVLLNLNDGSGGFGPQTTFAANGAGSVAVGDFNGDGAPDLAVDDLLGDTVSVLLNLNDGSGGFGPQTTFAAGDGPVSVAVGDFNGDGALDLAVADLAGDTVSVLLNLNDGSGGFGPQTPFAVGALPRSVAVGDFNGDGAPDLAVANLSDDTVSVLLGDGSGGFGLQTPFAVGDEPFSVAVGDFNGDGAPDLAVANGNEDNVSVLLGDGSGGFGPQTTFAAGDGPRSVAVGDFNGDGAPDLAVANGNDDNVSVLLNECLSFADLAISKAANLEVVKSGRDLLYTLRVVNHGPSDTLGVTVTDPLPVGATFKSATGNPASKPPAGSGGTVVWDLGALAVGEEVAVTVTLTVKVTARGGTTITNTATVDADDSTPDPQPADNTASVQTRIFGKRK